MFGAEIPIGLDRGDVQQLAGTLYLHFPRVAFLARDGPVGALSWNVESCHFLPDPSVLLESGTLT